MPARRLAPVFASIIAAVACGPRIDEDDFTSHCDQPLLSNVKLDPSIDGVELRLFTDVVTRIGDPCSKATDKAKCLAEFSAAASPRGMALVATSGDQVIFIEQAGANMSAVLGPIDTANEARLVASFGPARDACHVRPAGNGFELYGTRSGDNCGSKVAFILSVAPDGTTREVDTETLEDGDDSCSIGRRPTGLRRVAKTRGTGGWFADVARLEAASVVAFERLAAELDAHGAPQSLVRRALRAANDERRHTRMMDALARRHGTRTRPPRIGPARARTLEAMALENAREGCVRETYGALLASWQARTAGDRSVARAMAIVARDETRHAELSWDVAAFLATRLPPRAIERVERERARAAEKILREAARPPDPVLARVAGLPCRRDAQRLASAFVQSVLA